jgi:hypothetical protein
VRDELGAQVDRADRLPGHRVEVHLALRQDGVLEHDVEHAEAVQRTQGVGRELDAGPHLAELRRTLQDVDALAGAGQAERGGQAPDASAGHERADLDGLVRHVVLPLRARPAASPWPGRCR